MNYVVDASVAVKWYVPEIFESEASRSLSADHRLHVPELHLPEFANIIWKKVRRGELTSDEGDEIIDANLRRKWTIHDHRPILKPAYLGAVATGQTVYDWVYLALAVSLDCQMITADEKFYRALEGTGLVKNLKWIGGL